MFERCLCRDYARFDFRVDSSGEIKLLEVNPNPGWCWDGKFNFMASFGGLRYSEMLYMVLEAAQERTMLELVPSQQGESQAKGSRDGSISPKNACLCHDQKGISTQIESVDCNGKRNSKVSQLGNV